MKNPTKTNVHKITYLMTMNPGGPLAQAFMFEAIRRYAAEIVAAGEPQENPRAIISPTAWFDTAAAIANQLEHWGCGPARLVVKDATTSPELEELYMINHVQALAEANHRAAALMQQHGGGFAAALGLAYHRADSGNQARILGAFGHLFERFRREASEELAAEIVD